MSDNDLIRRGDTLKELEHTLFYDERDQRTAVECVKSKPAVPHEMTAREFVEGLSRICHTTFQCYNCPIYIEADKEKSVKYCWFWVRDNCEKAVSIVEQWAKDHPEKCKTYAEDILAKLPRIAKDDEGLPSICRNKLYDGENCYCNNANADCTACWNEEMEDEDE